MQQLLQSGAAREQRRVYLVDAQLRPQERNAGRAGVVAAGNKNTVARRLLFVPYVYPVPHVPTRIW